MQAEREHVPTDPDRVLFEALTSCNQEEDKANNTVRRTYLSAISPAFVPSSNLLGRMSSVARPFANSGTHERIRLCHCDFLTVPCGDDGSIRIT